MARQDLCMRVRACGSFSLAGREPLFLRCAGSCTVGPRCNNGCLTTINPSVSGVGSHPHGSRRVFRLTSTPWPKHDAGLSDSRFFTSQLLRIHFVSGTCRIDSPPFLIRRARKTPTTPRQHLYQVSRTSRHNAPFTCALVCIEFSFRPSRRGYTQCHYTPSREAPSNPIAQKRVSDSHSPVPLEKCATNP